MAFIPWFTVFSRRLGENREVRLELFWAFKALLNEEESGGRDAVQYFENLLLFMLFGYLFPCKNGKWIYAVLAGTALYWREHITAYRRRFRIHNFWTMVDGTSRLESTVKSEERH